MKKIISKLAFIGVAAAALCTSCVPEDIVTSFDLADAVYTVTITAKYLDGTDITNKTTFTHNYGSASSFTIPASDKTIAAQTITVEAAFAGYTQTKSLNVPTVLPGGSGSGSIEFTFGTAADYNEYEKNVGSDANSKTYSLFNTHYSSEDGWLYNNSEYILTGVVTYKNFQGNKLNSCDNDATVKQFADATIAAKPYSEVEGSMNITVSAWARYRVQQIVTITTYTQEVRQENTATGEDIKIGTYKYDNYSNVVNPYEEEASPSHAAHYEQGQGHAGHGGTDNAGGGINYGE